MECIDDPICALLVLKNDLGNYDRVRLNQSTTTNQTTNRRHGALYVGSRGARRKILGHHHKRSG